MTDREALILTTGVTFGVYLMLAVQLAFQAIEDRKDRQAVANALADIKQRATSDWRDAIAGLAPGRAQLARDVADGAA